MAGEVLKRRWRPGWLTRRVVAFVAIFTAMIFVVVLGVASVFARPPASSGSGPAVGSSPGTPVPVQKEKDDGDDDHR